MAFADLKPEQVAGYRAGRLTLADLASAAGITVQAVSQGLKRRERREARQKAADAFGAPAGMSAPPTSPAASTTLPGVAAAPDDDLEAFRAKVRHVAGHAALDLLSQLGALARGEDARLGASALKASVTALSGALDVLQRLQVIDAEGDTDELPELRIDIMSPDRAEEVRRQSEEGDAALDLDEADETDRPGIAGTAPSPEPAGNSRTVATPAPVLSAISMPALPDGIALPDGFDLAARLSAYASRHGAVALRMIAVAVSAPAGRSADSLIAAILERTAKDRGALAIAANTVLSAP